MKLEIISIYGKDAMKDILSIEPSSFKRQWMDDTDNQYAYRCLPLNIANQHGWAVYPKRNISFYWDGSNNLKKEAIIFYENDLNLGISWFGHGIVTFNIPFLVRLEQGYSLYITGAPNHPIEGIHPCTGIYEADWATYSFTMNWKITRPNYPITFTPNDPICFFFPIQQNLVENTETVYSTLEEQDEYFIEMYSKFNEDRSNFNANNKGDDWQKHYFQGLFPDGKKCPFDHKTKLKLKKFED